MFPNLRTQKDQESYLGLPPLDEPLILKYWFGPIDMVPGSSDWNPQRIWLPDPQPGKKRFLIGSKVLERLLLVADDYLRSELELGFILGGCCVLFFGENEDKVESLFEWTYNFCLHQVAQLEFYKARLALSLMERLIETAKVHPGPYRWQELEAKWIIAAFIICRWVEPAVFEEACVRWDAEDSNKRELILAEMDKVVSRIMS